MDRIRPRWIVVGLCILTLVSLGSISHARTGSKHMGGGGGALLGLCGSATTISNGLIVTEIVVKPTADQQAMLNKLKTAVKQNADALAIVCMGTGTYSGTMPERLAGSERRLAVAIDGIRKLKPLIEKFYATLSDEQKKEADGQIIFP